MKGLMNLSHFIGLEVESLKDRVFVSQKGYAEKAICNFGLNQSTWCSTPLDANIKSKLDEGKLLPDPQSYQALIGSLIYLTITRLDISFCVGLVSRNMHAPRKSHLEAMKRILRDVHSTFDMVLLFEKGIDFELIEYADPYLGGDLDDHKFTSGYVFSCGSACVSWCSKKQDSVSLSTTEAEYKVGSHATQECVASTVGQ